MWCDLYLYPFISITISIFGIPVQVGYFCGAVSVCEEYVLSPCTKNALSVITMSLHVHAHRRIGLHICTEIRLTPASSEHTLFTAPPFPLFLASLSTRNLFVVSFVRWKDNDCEIWNKNKVEHKSHTFFEYWSAISEVLSLLPSSAKMISHVKLGSFFSFSMCNSK